MKEGLKEISKVVIGFFLGCLLCIVVDLAFPFWTWHLGV